tara:strand:- start:998 stop:2392 length:1395 start_codon:yes stop_codon:yes gene_type:complete
MSAIPDLIKIGSIPGDMEMSVDTDTLEPVVASNTFCRFVLDKKGFMNSFSKILISMDDPTGEGGAHTYPQNVGINALIYRAVLKVGAKTLSSVEDYNHFQGYKSLFIDPSVNLEREQVISSRGNALSLRYNNTEGVYSDFNASSYGIANGKCYVQDGRWRTGTPGAVDYQSGLQPWNFQRLSNTPEFQLSLADLFPFLRYNSLPLYLFDEPISIELHFEPDPAKRTVGELSDASSKFNINFATGIKLIADYIYYDGETMEQFANANSNMNFQYVDYQLNKRTLTQAQAQTKQILNIGGAGRLVPKMFWALSDNAANASNLYNQYHSQAPSKTGANMGTLTTNLRYNDRYLYPLDRVSNSIHFHDITSTEAQQPNISRDMYSGGGDGITGQKYIGIGQNHANHGIKGKSFYQANRLNRNERINSRGIELELSYSSVPAGTYTHRAWIEVVRQATLKNGILDTTFA